MFDHQYITNSNYYKNDNKLKKIKIKKNHADDE